MSKELIQIDRRLRNIEEQLEKDDLINEQEACKWLGISLKTLQNKVYNHTLDGTYIVAKTGGRMFYKSKLMNR